MASVRVLLPGLVCLKSVLPEMWVICVEMWYAFNVFHISHAVLRIQVFLHKCIYEGEHQTQINWSF